MSTLVLCVVPNDPSTILGVFHENKSVNRRPTMDDFKILWELSGVMFDILFYIIYRTCTLKKMYSIDAPNCRRMVFMFFKSDIPCFILHYCIVQMTAFIMSSIMNIQNP